MPAAANGKRGAAIFLLMARCNGGDLRLDETQRGSSFTSVWPYAVTRAADSFPADPREFGALVRKTREEAGLTREQLSGLAGVASSTIRNTETGRHRPTTTARARILRALNLR